VQQAAAPVHPPAPAPTPAEPTPAAVIAPPRPVAPAAAIDGAWRGGKPACVRSNAGHEVDIELELSVTGGKVTGRLMASSFGPQSRDLGWTRTHEDLAGELTESGEFKSRSNLFSVPIAVRFGTGGGPARAMIGRCELALDRGR
jgi:hypothetical protein